MLIFNLPLFIENREQTQAAWKCMSKPWTSVIYADTELLLEKGVVIKCNCNTGNSENSSTTKTNRHAACLYWSFKHFSFDPKQKTKTKQNNKKTRIDR